MNQIDIALATIAATVLAVGVFSQALKRSPLQEPLIAVAVGIAVGPHGLGWLEPASWTDQLVLLEQMAEVTLAIAIMAATLRISHDDVRHLWRPVAILLTAGMLGMWIASSLSAAWLLQLPLWSAALLGAAITPTDPVVAGSIVTGKFAQEHLPRRIRASLSLESGANDGLGYLFIMLPILMLSVSPEESWQRWLIEDLIRGVLGAVVIGAALGYGAGRLLHWAHTRGVIDNYSLLTFTVTLSLFTLGAANLAMTDALLAVFVAGLVFALSSDTGDRHEEEQIQESLSKLFTLPTLVVFGLALPISAWGRYGWELAMLALAILFLRRLPVLALLYPSMRGSYSVRDTAFLAWFGPIGIAAIYYAAFAVQQTGRIIVWEVTSAVVFTSIVVHGVTAAPFTRRYDSSK